MPNAHSKAGHIPLRTCVICRNKREQKQLLGFYILDKEIVFDINRLASIRKKYVCHTTECLAKLDKWLSKQRKKSVAK